MNNINSTNFTKNTDYKEGFNVTQRHVGKIYKKIQEGNILTSSVAKVWSVVFPILLFCTIIFIPRAVRFNERLKIEAQKNQFEKDVKTITPPVHGEVLIDTKVETSNHIASYIIHDDIVWTKSKMDQNAQWTPMFMDGYPEKKPIEIRADGANLMVVDNTGEVHYKKTIKEKRIGDDYHYADKSTKDNWKETWFTLPGISKITNLFTVRKLFLPNQTKAWAIGHRGQLTGGINDAKGRFHKVDAGVTTMYVLDKNGKDIFLYDPWKPQTIKVSVPITETADEPFVAENINVAGSTVMVIGYSYKNDENGISVKTPEIRTFMCDIDSLGWNPILKYTYNENTQNSEERILPTQKKFETHKLPDGNITSTITIVQTGLGNDAREMRVFGDQEGVPGFFSKNLNEAEWNFHPHSVDEIGAPMVEEESVMPPNSVKNWKGRIEEVDLSIHNFNENTVYADVKDGEKVMFFLHRKENIIQKLITGKDSHLYDLVPTAEAELEQSFKNRFKKMKPMRVKVIKDQQGKLSITGQGLNVKFNIAS